MTKKREIIVFYGNFSIKNGRNRLFFGVARKETREKIFNFDDICCDNN